MIAAVTTNELAAIQAPSFIIMPATTRSQSPCRECFPRPEFMQSIRYEESKSAKQNQWGALLRELTDDRLPC
jgi:hypothetical protein